MSTKDVAEGMTALLKAQKFEEAGQTYWADDVVSIEPMGPPGMPLEMHGKEAVAGKGKWFIANHTIANHTVEGPYVNGDKFALRMVSDITPKADGQTRRMEEIGLYTVKDGKVVEERFMIIPMG